MDSPKVLRSSSSTSVSSSNSDKEESHPEIIELIENHDKLLVVFERIKSEEFPELLYRLFESHNKTHDLFSCAIEKDLSSVVVPEEFTFTSNSILYQLLLILIHGDFGRKYIQLSLVPIIDNCTKYSQGEVSSKPEDQFLKASLIGFFSDLAVHSERCPIGFQDALIQLKEAFKLKFPSQSETTLPRLLFTSFFCNILENPLDFIDKTKDVDFKAARTCSHLYQKMSQLLQDPNFLEISPVFLNLFNKLSDPATVATLKELVDSNTVVNASKMQNDAENRMYNFLKGIHITRRIKDHLEYEKYKKRFEDVISDPEGWTKMKGSKKYNIELNTKRFDWSPLVVWKVATVFKCSLAKIKPLLWDYASLAKLDKRVQFAKQLESLGIENRRDFYLRLHPSFPVAGRDLRFARYDSWTDKLGSCVCYSVEDPEFPKFPKTVRGTLVVSGYKLIENEAGNEVTYTYLVQLDPAGSLPTWFLNKWGDGFVDEIKIIHNVLAK